MLRPTFDLGFDAGLGEFLAQPGGDGLHVVLAVGAPLRHQPGDLLVLVGDDVAERQILQLPLHLPDAQAVGQGREDLQRLDGDALPLFHRQIRQRAHVVKPIGQLDDDDADVVAHRQKRLAQRFLGQLGSLRVALGAGGGAADARQLVQFGDAVDEGGHLRPEIAPDVLQPHRRIFDRVVQQAGR